MQMGKKQKPKIFHHFCGGYPTFSRKERRESECDVEWVEKNEVFELLQKKRIQDEEWKLRALKGKKA